MVGRNEDLVVNEEDDVDELDGGVVAEDGVVGLDDSGGNLREF
jgi:hypothetical protein